MWFSIVTVVIGVTFITWGVFASVAPAQTCHAIDIMLTKLLIYYVGKQVDLDVLIKRIELYRNNPTLYAQQYHSEIRSTRLGGISLAIASCLALLWGLGIIG